MEFMKLKFQICGLQRTLMSRLDIMDDVSLMKVFGRIRKLWPKHKARVERMESIFHKRKHIFERIEFYVFFFDLFLVFIHVLHLFFNV